MLTAKTSLCFIATTSRLMLYYLNRILRRTENVRIVSRDDYDFPNPLAIVCINSMPPGSMRIGNP